jgi:Type II restriction endonuclease, TdeIII
MNTETRAQVGALISEFMAKWIADSIPATELERIAAEGVSPSGLLTPFHDALVPGITLLGERSFSTRLGNLHEKIAAVIASEIHAEVRQPQDLAGAIPVLSREFITQRISALEHREAEPDASYERQQIFSHFGNQVTRRPASTSTSERTAARITTSRSRARNRTRVSASR